MQNFANQTTTNQTADVVQNDATQSGNFSLNGAAVVANGVQISEASKKAVAEQISGVNQAIFALEQLEAEREHWEANELAASHKRLYSLLTRCYQYYLDMKLSPSKAERDDKRKRWLDYGSPARKPITSASSSAMPEPMLNQQSSSQP